MRTLDCKGSITVEACIAVPVFLCFFAFFLCVNVSFFSELAAYCSRFTLDNVNYADVHRAAEVIFETGGDLYDLFFS